MTVRGLLLDVDGTLVLSERVHRITWQQVFDDHGVHVDEERYRASFMGRRAHDVLTQESGPWQDGDIPAVVAGMVAHGLELGGEVDVVPGAEAAVRAAVRAGVPVAVVTSAGSVWAEHVLGAVLGVRDQVAAVVTAEQVAVGKPDPAGYLLACAAIGVAPPDCLGVEDSPSGLAALVAAGVGHRFGVTTSSSAADLRAAGAHRTAPDLTPLAPLLAPLPDAPEAAR